MPNQKGNFKVAGATRTWDGGSSTKFYIDIDKDGKYPKIGEFEFFGDNIKLGEFKAGDEVDVSFNIDGSKREWVDKKSGQKKSGFFQNLTAWKMEKLGSSNNGSLPPSENLSEEESLDLPF